MIREGTIFKIQSGVFRVVSVGKFSSTCIGIDNPKDIRRVNNVVIKMNIMYNTSEAVYMKSLKIGDVVLIDHPQLGEIEVEVKKINSHVGLFYWAGTGSNSRVMGAIKGKNALKKIRSTNEAKAKIEYGTVKVEHPEYGTVEVSLAINQDTGKYRIAGVGIEGDDMVTMVDLDPADKRIIRKLVKEAGGASGASKPEPIPPAEHEKITDDDLPDFLR